MSHVADGAVLSRSLVLAASLASPSLFPFICQVVVTDGILAPLPLMDSLLSRRSAKGAVGASPSHWPRVHESAVATNGRGRRVHAGAGSV